MFFWTIKGPAPTWLLTGLLRGLSILAEQGMNSVEEACSIV